MKRIVVVLWCLAPALQGVVESPVVSEKVANTTARVKPKSASKGVRPVRVAPVKTASASTSSSLASQLANLPPTPGQVQVMTTAIENPQTIFTGAPVHVQKKQSDVVDVKMYAGKWGLVGIFNSSDLVFDKVTRGKSREEVRDLTQELLAVQKPDKPVVRFKKPWLVGGKNIIIVHAKNKQGKNVEIFLEGNPALKVAEGRVRSEVVEVQSTFVGVTPYSHNVARVFYSVAGGASQQAALQSYDAPQAPFILSISNHKTMPGSYLFDLEVAK